MTEAKIAKFLKQGRGSGHLATYRPWLTIQDVPSRGLRSRIKGAKTGRGHHLLSTEERKAFLDCEWCEVVVDVREQFPLDRAETVAIADDMGVRHPSDAGVDVVMTTDLVIDLVAGDGPRMVALCIKLAADLEDDRKLEKIEIERRYWKARGVPHHVVTEHELSGVRTGNLLHFAEWRDFDGLDEPRPGYWVEVGEAVTAIISRAGDEPLADVLAGLDRDRGYELGDSLAVFRHLVTNRRLALDLDVAFDPSMPTSRIRVTAPVRAGSAA